VASDHCYPGKTAAGFERLSPLTWREMVGLTPAYSFSTDCRRAPPSLTADERLHS